MYSNKIIKSNVVDVSVGDAAVTSKTAAKIMISIVEFLLYNWNQIPLVFEQFRHMIEKFSEAKNTNELDAVVKNYKIERQRNEAIQVYQKYKQLSDVSLCNIFLRTGECSLRKKIFGFRLYINHSQVVLLNKR